MVTPELIPGGVPLAQVPGMSAAQVKMLNECWLVTAQEFVALAACPDVVRTPLAAALRVSLAELDRLADAARGVIPTTRSVRSAQLALEAVPANYGRGALLDEPPEVLAARRNLPAYQPPDGRAVLPPSFSLLGQLPPVRNQGGRGTCVAHAVVAVREQLEIAAAAPLGTNLSEQYVYWWCKANDGIPTVSGTYVSVGMRCLERNGAPPESAWPYVSADRPGDEGQGPPPPAAAGGDGAMRTLRTQEFRSSDITGIKTCLAEGRAVAFSIPVFDSWYHSSATSRWGKITLPLPNEAPDGGHAMTLVGYADDPATPGGGYFLVRNSWQPWAYDGAWEEGYGHIAYAYISRHGTAVFSAHRLAGADLIVRDHAGDTGLRPLAAPRLVSPAVWLRQAPDDGQTHQAPQPGAANALYLHLTNRGPAYAYDISAKVWAAPLAPVIPPDAWQPIGRLELPVLPPGEHSAGPLSWTPPAARPIALRVGLDSPSDPLADDATPANSNNLAECRLWPLALAPGATGELAWDVSAPAGPGEVAFAVDRAGLPPGVTVTDVEFTSPLGGPRRGIVEDALLGALGGGAVLAAGGSRRARLTVTLAPAATPGARGVFVVSQSHSGQAVGQMTAQVEVTS